MLFDRFYGRIAVDSNKHDEITLKAIKENASGLQNISGERIWVELKKILEGRFAGELILKILACNLGTYIGKDFLIIIHLCLYIIGHGKKYQLKK